MVREGWHRQKSPPRDEQAWSGQGEVNKRCASRDKIQLIAKPISDVKARAKNNSFQIFTPSVINRAVPNSVFSVEVQAENRVGRGKSIKDGLNGAGEVGDGGTKVDRSETQRTRFCMKFNTGCEI
jgi:hypothetical protein